MGIAIANRKNRCDFGALSSRDMPALPLLWKGCVDSVGPSNDTFLKLYVTRCPRRGCNSQGEKGCSWRFEKEVSGALGKVKLSCHPRGGAPWRTLWYSQHVMLVAILQQNSVVLAFWCGIAQFWARQKPIKEKTPTKVRANFRRKP